MKNSWKSFSYSVRITNYRLLSPLTISFMLSVGNDYTFDAVGILYHLSVCKTAAHDYSVQSVENSERTMVVYV